ncbi:Uncharacterized protein DBV15_12871 [Temnothorax longispinosus]|uniref:Endonuclease/exonuclease/phosphatase domain-containing protein n=1 Tax=Temnothorax longispinosus TaxID=300112 RepID=A0A4S2JWR8_9HYME|nr:Uncharacterized protein DBV15_12871 [Temnothorax longispinosus]
MKDSGLDKKGIRMIVWNVAGVKKEKDWENWCERMPSGWRWISQCARRENKKGRAMGGIITGVREELEEEEYVDTTEGIQETTSGRGRRREK